MFVAYMTAPWGISMSESYEKGKAITQAIGLLRFLPSDNNFKALVTFPYILFEEYLPDTNRMYERGEVVRVGREKYLFQGDGRLDKSPKESPLCKLFRDAGRYEWVREEYCIEGFIRHWKNPSKPDENGWYRVVTDNAGDNVTPPPGVPWVWERVTA